MSTMNIREASLAHAKDINSYTRSTKKGQRTGFEHVSTVLSDAQDIYEYLTQDAVERTEKDHSDESPGSFGELRARQEYTAGWNEAIETVLGLQLKHGLALSDSVPVRAVQQAVVALKKGNYRG